MNPRTAALGTPGLCHAAPLARRYGHPTRAALVQRLVLAWFAALARFAGFACITGLAGLAGCASDTAPRADRPTASSEPARPLPSLHDEQNARLERDAEAFRARVSIEALPNPIRPEWWPPTTRLEGERTIVGGLGRSASLEHAYHAAWTRAALGADAQNLNDFHIERAAFARVSTGDHIVWVRASGIPHSGAPDSANASDAGATESARADGMPPWWHEGVTEGADGAAACGQASAPMLADAIHAAQDNALASLRAGARVAGAQPRTTHTATTRLPNGRFVAFVRVSTGR